MDVIFETRKGEGTFTMEIGYFDTTLEIKEKIEKYRGIPSSRQTLMLDDGKELVDEDNVFENGKIFHNSRILIADSAEVDDISLADTAELDNRTSFVESAELDNTSFVESADLDSTSLDDSAELDNTNLVESAQPDDIKVVKNGKKSTTKPLQHRTIQLRLKLPSFESWVRVVVDSDFLVRNLKKKIHQLEDEAWESVPSDMLVLHVIGGGIELQDKKYLYEYDQLMNASSTEIQVSVQDFPVTLNLFVLSRCQTKKIQVGVNHIDKVQVLRRKLEEAQTRSEFVLPDPDEGYFFIHKQNVMLEKETFQWHDCQQGDLVEVFNGWAGEGPYNQQQHTKRTIQRTKPYYLGANSSHHHRS